MAFDPMVFQFIGETVTNATDAFVTPATKQLMLALQLVMVTCVTLYITMTGYAISTGGFASQAGGGFGLTHHSTGPARKAAQAGEFKR